MIMEQKELITIEGRDYLKFWPRKLSDPVTDGTLRCIFCGQIDEPEFHEADKCCACPEWDGVNRQSAE